MPVHCYFAIPLLLLSLCLPALGEPEPSQGIREFHQPFAQAGDESAQYKLGVAYASGKGGDKDPVLAVYWFTKAAEQEHLKAQFALAEALRVGQGTVQDHRAAFIWYEKAAQQGHTPSRHALALAILGGLGTKKDVGEGIRRLQELSDSSHVPSLILLSNYYLKGEHVDKDPRKAKELLVKAAATGDTEASLQLAEVSAPPVKDPAQDLIQKPPKPQQLDEEEPLGFTEGPIMRPSLWILGLSLILFTISKLRKLMSSRRELTLRSQTNPSPKTPKTISRTFPDKPVSGETLFIPGVIKGPDLQIDVRAQENNCVTGTLLIDGQPITVKSKTSDPLATLINPLLGTFSKVFCGRPKMSELRIIAAGAKLGEPIILDRCDELYKGKFHYDCGPSSDVYYMVYDPKKRTIEVERECIGHAWDA